MIVERAQGYEVETGAREKVEDGVLETGCQGRVGNNEAGNGKRKGLGVGMKQGDCAKSAVEE